MPYTPFTLNDGTQVMIEVEDTPGPRQVSAVSDRFDQAVSTLESGMDSIRKATASILERLRSGMPEEPDSIGLEFGLKASVEVNGLVIAKVAAEANYCVKMTW